MKIIDCTLRDGGYLTGWDFDINFVKSLYRAACDAKTDYFEVGYRNVLSAGDFGEFYFCNDDFLFSLFDGNCKLSVMADVGKSDLSAFKTSSLENTPISLVRVAVYPERLSEAFDFCEGLKDKNYEVMLNLMAFGRYTQKDIDVLKNWNEKNILEAVCFSDSFGSFTPGDIETQFLKLRDIGFQKISFHSHNNLQLAFANSIVFADLGGYSLDASVAGLGRNGGILPIELITGYCQEKSSSNYDVLPYLNFIYRNDNYFKNVDLIALISGFKNIHPKYVKELFDNYSDISVIWQKAEELKQKNIVSYRTSVNCP